MNTKIHIMFVFDQVQVPKLIKMTILVRISHVLQTTCLTTSIDLFKTSSVLFFFTSFCPTMKQNYHSNQNLQAFQIIHFK